MIVFIKASSYLQSRGATPVMACAAARIRRTLSVGEDAAAAFSLGRPAVLIPHLGIISAKPIIALETILV